MSCFVFQDACYDVVRLSLIHEVLARWMYWNSCFRLSSAGITGLCHTPPALPLLFFFRVFTSWRWRSQYSYTVAGHSSIPGLSAP